MKVICKVLDREVDGVHFVDIRNYLGRRLCWYVKVICGTKDPCKSCDFNYRPVCFEVPCDCENRNSCYKCVHEGDVLISCVERDRVYVVVKEGEYLKARLATQKDLDSDNRLHRVRTGGYLYRGYWIQNLGPHESDHRDVWVAKEINNPAVCASVNELTLERCLFELRSKLGETDVQYGRIPKKDLLPDRHVSSFNGKEWVGY